MQSSSRGQGNFLGLEASRPRTSKCVLENSTSASSHPDITFSKAEVESRTQGSRPRTQKKSEAKDRRSRGQGHKAQVLSKKKKKVFTKIFQAISKKKKKKRSSQKFFKRSPLKNVFQTIFQALHKILTFQKLVLSSSRGQANFRGLEAKDLTFEAKAKDFKLCPRGQGRPRGLHLCSKELETNNYLAYLDTFINTSNCKFETSVFRKKQTQDCLLNGIEYVP